MISKPILREVIRQRLKDAKALFIKRRYHASIYLAGYAVELALKYKVCKMYFFTKGFPETSDELQEYYKQTKNKRVRAIISKIQDIRHHDLAKLLVYSGEEYNIKKNFFNEWMTILNWSPEMRYAYSKIKKNITEDNLTAIQNILDSIL